MRIRTCILGAPLVFVLATGCTESAPTTPPAEAAPATPVKEVGKTVGKRKPKTTPGATGPDGIIP
jgi:hypothetical protein